MTKIVYYLNSMACTCLLCAGMLLTGCYDDSEILESLKNQQEQIDELKALCSEYNASIESLQAVVSALQAKDYVTGISPVKQGSEVVGYTISFEKSGAVTIYHGKDGADGIDGHTPVIGVKQWTDGLWYWTIDGDWLLDSEGNKVKASGTDGADGEDGKDGADGTNGFTPVLKIDDGYWYVSYDGGKTYGTTPVGQATGDAGYTMFEEVTYDEGYVYVTMTDGTTLKLTRISENGSVNTFWGVSISMSYDVTPESVVLHCKFLLEDDVIADSFGIIYSTSEDLNGSNATVVPIVDLYGDSYSLEIDLEPATIIYCTTYIKQGAFYRYGQTMPVITPIPEVPDGYTDLSSKGLANCYIIDWHGRYCLPVVKGNDASEILHSPRSAEVLWESFGTDVTPNVGDLIESISYKDGYIMFETTGRDGNAVIAAKNASGDILWSWHIWIADAPGRHYYRNSAGTMMDRNLGATSADPGDFGSHGLFYQWGRKDPFLGTYSISERSYAKSTITWPSPSSSYSSSGTIEYATAHPTTFIRGGVNGDWYYTGNQTTDNTRWTTSDKPKSIYDPCPAGWRVPDGGDAGVWATALGSSASYQGTPDQSEYGMDFSYYMRSYDQGYFWYPSPGWFNGGVRSNYIGQGFYWSASPADGTKAYNLEFQSSRGLIYPANSSNRALGYSVRCFRE